MITFNNQDTLKQYVLDELKETDYAMLSDVYILNKAEFITYRRSLRQALKDLYLSTQFTERPQPVWGAIQQTPAVSAEVNESGITTL
jgi:hypothetical protein